MNSTAPHSSCDALQSVIELAEEDFEAASCSSFAHGTLLTLRYAVEAAPWLRIASDAARNGAICAAFNAALNELLSQIEQVAQLVLPTLALHDDSYIGTLISADCCE